MKSRTVHVLWTRILYAILVSVDKERGKESHGSWKLSTGKPELAETERLR
jgi:hypothetical protein